MIFSEKDKHVLHRAAFGPALADKSQNFNVASWMDKARGNRPIKVVEKVPVQEGIDKAKQNVKQAFIKSRDQVVTLNTTWMTQLTDRSLLLREKMTLFWHDHFACRVRAAYLAQQQNNILRHHALGSFSDLLFAISKDPAMLQFLNNQQNKKNSPNENFAREVLELFTLGSGHYTEDDIKNSARAFTGWAYNPVSGKFFFREKVHDDGIKTFKGKRGRFSGEDILNIILEDKHTARFIVEKLYRYFVSTEQVDEEIITSLATTFYESGYNIEKILTEIFTSSWFYEPRFIGNRIKSPVELMAGISTQTMGEFENPQAVVFIQRAMSQVLFLPPNVGGWPTGTAWIDSSSLTFRMALAGVLLKNSETEFEAKDDGDANNATNLAKAKRLSFKVDWPVLATHFIKGNAQETMDMVESYLLATPASPINKKIVSDYAGKSITDPEFIKKCFIGFMSLPEYQLS